MLRCTESAINNLNREIYYFIFPCILIVVNDTFSYLVGKSIGKTKLVTLSPKKTVEGLLGGLFFTVVLGIPISHLIKPAGLRINSTDSIILSLLASLVAPIGGILASAYKRAFNVKHFSRILPGHGGIVDRIDCQLIMQFLTDFYLTLKRREDLIRTILKEINTLRKEERMELIKELIRQEVEL